MHSSPLRRSLVAILLPGTLFCCLPGVALADGPVEAAAQTFAKSSVDNGAAVGVGVGIIVKEQPPRFFSYGFADATRGLPFGPDSVFEIGSVTKVFTANLLGQAVYKGRLSLNDPLSAFGTQLGTFKLLTRQVTLKQLADFTSGFPDLAPSCNTQEPVPGCLPSSRPTPGAYNAQTFLKFFQNTVPKNYQATPPKKVSSLPAPYFYSDFSLGLLGLILGGNPRVSLSNEALGGWVKLLENRLLLPLGMRNTYLYPLPNNQGRLALGYDQAVATAVIAAGQVQEIKLEVPGSGYESPPKVRIKGGGGTGAEATAQVDSKGAVKGFAVTQGGHGYLPPLVITFTPPSGGNGSNSSPKAAVIVSNKKVVGFKIIDRGSGYKTAPAVVISGGRRSGIGQDAKGTAHIANGAVTFVSINDGGDGYEEPVAVTMEPGAAFTSPVPIWAPAGALHSTIRDMTNFAAVALGRARHGFPSADPAITAGFKIAETPYACSGPLPDLANCPAETLLSGLAWAILPEDKVNNVPTIVLKNGGLPGFSTQVILMPSRGLAVVVFVNSNGETDTGEKTGQAEVIARNILYALYYELAWPGAQPN